MIKTTKEIDEWIELNSPEWEGNNLKVSDVLEKVKGHVDPTMHGYVLLYIIMRGWM